jgi:acetyltransferase-like isoleucine patch superfamily enzyme
MGQNKLALLRVKLQDFQSGFRRLWYESLGLKIGTGSSIGRIGFTWPGSIQIGSSCVIEDMVDFKIAHPFKDNNYINIGDRTFIGRCCEFHTTDKIIIGRDCLIASQNIFVGVGHEYSRDSLINLQGNSSGDIVLEDDVWIGTGSKILLGVVIGQGSIVGAGSVVNKSIPPYEIWAGVPAKFIKKRV